MLPLGVSSVQLLLGLYRFSSVTPESFFGHLRLGSWLWFSGAAIFIAVTILFLMPLRSLEAPTRFRSRES
ncbi:MAG: hypothetical protein QOG52_1261 [Frankiaceae bacterium]|jgi:hypothetical protein|nr:hypothetical protein [Frankiaceae bacterium]